MKEWLKNASEIGLTKTEATVLFQTFKIYEGDLPESTLSIKIDMNLLQIIKIL